MATSVELLHDRHRSRVSAPGPRREQQQQSRLAERQDLVALARLELDQEPRAAADAPAGGRGHLDLTVDDHDPGTLVHLVVAQLLPFSEVERERARLVAGGEDLRQPRLEIQLARLPALHRLRRYSKRRASIR